MMKRFTFVVLFVLSFTHTHTLTLILQTNESKTKMEALALGYGSDDDSSSNSTTSSTNNNNNNKETNNALDLLASNYSGDSDDIDDVDGNDNVDDLKRKQNHNDVVTEVLDEPNNHKKLKSNCDNDETIGYVFPVPRLCNPEIDNSFDGLVLFPKDYISHEMNKVRNISSHTEQGLQEESKNKVSSLLESKLDKMYHQFYSEKVDDNKGDEEASLSFAKHLKSQKEFGNPHLFPSIITHFGIDPLGSNCMMTHSASMMNNGNTSTSSSNKQVFAKFEYVEKLAQKEEENRIRNSYNHEHK